MENLLIAKVAKPQGLKGELKCQLFTDVIAALTEAKFVIIDNQSCEVESAKIRQGDLYLKLLGVDDRNHAEIFRNQEIYLPKSALKSHYEGEFLVDDLLGMVLYDEKGELVGQILDYEDYGSAPILSIDVNSHVYELPYIEDIFKTENGKIIVNRSAFEETKL